MNRIRRSTIRSRAVVAAALSIGLLSGTGCTEAEIEAVLTGVRILADELSQQQEDEDISFGDWLADELSD
jgi:hypothetical protein